MKSRRHNTQVGEERDENGKDLPALRIAVDGTEVLPHGKGILKNGNTNMCKTFFIILWIVQCNSCAIQ